MTLAPGAANLRGIMFMIAAMGAFVVNDTFLKLATETLPPFQTLWLRSVFALLWGVPLLWVTKSFRALPLVADRKVMLRNLFELLAVLGFIIGLANVSIADITALSQLAPILVVLGAALFMKARVTRLQVAMAILAFGGAVMVAQPGSSAFSVYALFGVWNAVIVAFRDLAGRGVGAHVPGAVVAVGSALVVLLGTAVIGPATESWQAPSWREIGLVAAAALFLMAGHFSIFMAYRMGEPGAVGPFFYTSAIWALVSAMIVFGTPPNGLALAGIALIVACGVAVVLGDRKRGSGATVSAT